jgi:hypothetical protein
MDFTLSKIGETATMILSHLSTVIFKTKRFVRASHVDNSFCYIFIYHFPYLLTHYYSFLAHYHNKCLDIN